VTTTDTWEPFYSGCFVNGVFTEDRSRAPRYRRTLFREEGDLTLTLHRPSRSEVIHVRRVHVAHERPWAQYREGALYLGFLLPRKRKSNVLFMTTGTHYRDYFTVERGGVTVFDSREVSDFEPSHAMGQFHRVS